MSGIKAQSATKTMIDGDTDVDQAVSGYVANEQIVLTVTGSPSSCRWAMAKPSGSGMRSNLANPLDLSTTFVPDVEGYYTIECVVDGTTTYILRIAVAQVGAVTTLTSIRFVPISNAQIPTPRAGRTVYFSSNSNSMVEKRPDGTVHPFTVT